MALVNAHYELIHVDTGKSDKHIKGSWIKTSEFSSTGCQEDEM